MDILSAVAIVESSKNPLAMRFEPVLYKNPPQWLIGAGQLDAIKKYNWDVSDDTALALACTSFGEWQILGGNLYGPVLKFDRPLFSFLCSFSTQQKIAAAFIRSLGFDPTANVTTPGAMTSFAIAYNGPGATATDYAHALCRAASA